MGQAASASGGVGMSEITLPDQVRRALLAGVDRFDVLHGHLKNMILEAGGGDDVEPTDPYARGVLDTLGRLYSLTYSYDFVVQEGGRA